MLPYIKFHKKAFQTQKNSKSAIRKYHNKRIPKWDNLKINTKQRKLYSIWESEFVNKKVRNFVLSKTKPLVTNLTKNMYKQQIKYEHCVLHREMSTPKSKN